MDGSTREKPQLSSHVLLLVARRTRSRAQESFALVQKGLYVVRGYMPVQWPHLLERRLCSVIVQCRSSSLCQDQAVTG